MIGKQLGQFLIEAKLGAGGMGEVFRARDTRLDRDVAIKALPEAFAEDTGRLDRFRREAKALAALNHAHIATIHDLVEADGRLFMVMELLEGEDLTALIGRGPVPVDDALRIAHQIATGLQTAHEKGIIHRDLKPGNVRVGDGLRVKILDFGLAKSATVAAAGGTTQAVTVEATPTVDGAILGTYPYMSPEQARGKPADKRSDIWSFGCVLWEMLVGARPFPGETQTDLLTNIVNADPEWDAIPSGLPPAIRYLLRRCLRKDPRRRLQDIGDARVEIEDVLEGESPTPAVEAGRTRPSFRQLTFRRGAVFGARFTPDAQTILYGAMWEERPARIYSVHPDGAGSQALPLPPANLLSISAKGDAAIALNYDHGHGFWWPGTLARVPITGGGPRSLLEDVNSADWSPDGEGMAVAYRDPSGAHRVEYPVGHVVWEAQGIGWNGDVRVSPDGSRVAFVAHPSPGDDGSVMIADRAGEARMLSAQWNSVQGLAWHPSGKEIWITAAREGALRSIYAIDLGGRVRLVEQSSGWLILHDLAPDGRAIVERDSARQTILGAGPEDSKERNLSWFDWSILTDLSRDGTQLLLHESGEAVRGRYSLFMRSIDGSPPVLLASDSNMGRFSPDGKWVVALPQDRDAQEIRTYPTGLGAPQVVSTAPILPVSLPLLMAGGETIVFAGADPDGEHAMYAVGRDGTEPARLPIDTPDKRYRLQGTVSPNGQWLAVAGGSGPARLFHWETGEARDIPGLRPKEEVIAWNASGDAVYVGHLGVPPVEISLLALPSGDRRLVRSLAPADPAGAMIIYHTNVTPDGGTYAYTLAQKFSELFLVEGLA